MSKFEILIRRDRLTVGISNHAKEQILNLTTMGRAKSKWGHREEYLHGTVDRQKVFKLNWIKHKLGHPKGEANISFFIPGGECQPEQICFCLGWGFYALFIL